MDTAAFAGVFQGRGEPGIRLGAGVAKLGDGISYKALATLGALVLSKFQTGGTAWTATITFVISGVHVLALVTDLSSAVSWSDEEVAHFAIALQTVVSGRTIAGFAGDVTSAACACAYVQIQSL